MFRTKPAQQLVDEAYEGDRKMKRSLRAIDLIAFGVGATIGSGIFALTGTAAAGQAAVEHRDWLSTPVINFILGSPLGREAAGPALVISFLIAAIACGFAAMCYAELAAMIPVSGSAYTFAYAALGELIAWIIGWDLMLEYAIGNVAVAVSWSDHFLHFIHGAFNMKIPLWLSTDTGTALTRLATLPVEHPQWGFYSSTELPLLFGHQFAMNVPAFVIVMLITWVLIIGIQESAIVNSIAVIIKVLVVIFFIWSRFRQTGELGAFCSGWICRDHGWSRHRFLQFHRLRRGQLDRRRDKKSPARHAYRDDWIAYHLLSSLYRGLSCVDRYNPLSEAGR